MIRNLCTCRAHAIRPYTDGRKGLFLRSIWDYEKLYDPFFDLENVHAESIIPLLESRKGHAKWQEKISGKCFREVFLRYLFQGIFFFVTKRKHSGFVVKSGVQNGKSLFEKVYSSSSSCMDALSENKQ